MACCAALTLIVAWAYRVVSWALPGRADHEFAPPAVWPPARLELAPAAARPDRPPAAQASMGHALIVLGVAWFASGLLAMHVFGVVDPIRSAPVDLAFHASGLWVATIGVALRFQPTRLIRRTA